MGRFAGRRLLDDDDIARLEDRIDAESAARAAYAALAGLADNERAVLELVAVDGLAVKDAAAALGISPGAARIRLHRARRSAKSLFDRTKSDAAECRSRRCPPPPRRHRRSGPGSADRAARRAWPRRPSNRCRWRQGSDSRSARASPAGRARG
ncbi:MAG TPA: sigma-70 region 4 domain-containing protein [Streptosporangiaceae bacterium]|nr:sigma-70 region 4 domain-containing protein [Streptosporangiaceae bacterium]